jgi:hypothetical protein
MDTRVFPQVFAIIFRAFVRSQWIAAPLGLTLAAMECIGPDRCGMCFVSAATTAWYVVTPIAMILCLAFGT